MIVLRAFWEGALDETGNDLKSGWQKGVIWRTIKGNFGAVYEASGGHLEDALYQEQAKISRSKTSWQRPKVGDKDIILGQGF